MAAAMGCLHFGARHAAFLLALCAADATAKRRFPTESDVGRRFKDFLSQSMPLLCGVEKYWVAVDMPQDRTILETDQYGIAAIPEVGDKFRTNLGQPRKVLLEGVLYHAFRCALSHEADLPEVELLPPTPDGALCVVVDDRVRISADIVARLLEVVANAPENRPPSPER